MSQQGGHQRGDKSRVDLEIVIGANETSFTAHAGETKQDGFHAKHSQDTEGDRQANCMFRGVCTV